MMKGNNEMVLNTATMIEIVQYWLDNKFTNPQSGGPYVINFIAGTNPCAVFIVQVSDEPK